MNFVVHFFIGTVAASSMIAFNFTGFNVFPYFLKNMTLTETLSASPSIIPSVTPFINNFTNSSVGLFENASAIINTTNTTIPLNVTGTNITTPTTIPLNVIGTNITTPTTIPLNVTTNTKPPIRSYLRYSRPPTKTRSNTNTPSRTSKYS